MVSLIEHLELIPAGLLLTNNKLVFFPCALLEVVLGEALW